MNTLCIVCSTNAVGEEGIGGMKGGGVGEEGVVARTDK